MNSTFKPLTRCPGHAGIHCEALIDKSVRRQCGSCLGLARLSKEMPDQARARDRDGNAAPPHEAVWPPSAPHRGVTTSLTTDTKGGAR